MLLAPDVIDLGEKIFISYCSCSHPSPKSGDIQKVLSSEHERIWDLELPKAKQRQLDLVWTKSQCNFSSWAKQWGDVLILSLPILLFPTSHLLYIVNTDEEVRQQDLVFYLSAFEPVLGTKRGLGTRPADRVHLTEWVNSFCSIPVSFFCLVLISQAHPGNCSGGTI